MLERHERRAPIETPSDGPSETSITVCQRLSDSAAECGRGKTKRDSPEWRVGENTLARREMEVKVSPSQTHPRYMDNLSLSKCEPNSSQISVLTRL